MFDAVMSTTKEDSCIDWDLGGHSPAKYPKTSKRKPKKASEEPKKKARKNLTLEIPMREVPPVVNSRKYKCWKKGKYSILINSWMNWINTPPNPSYVLVT